MHIVAHTMEYRGKKIYSELRVSNYSAENYPEYKRIYEECFFEMRTALKLVPVNCCDTDNELMQKASNIFILKKDGIFVGSVAIYENEIDDLIVAKEFQRQGYGTRLLLLAISKIQEDALSPIILHVADWNKNAIHMYLSNGFEIVKTETVS